MVSFLPLFFLSGMEGRMLVPLGIAFITALAASTVVALTVTPVLCSLMLKYKGRKTEKESADAPVARWLKVKYERMLLFLPPFNEGSFTINVSSLPGISLEESDRIGRRAEELLLSIPEIQTVARKTGRAELDEHALGVNVSEIRTSR